MIDQGDHTIKIKDKFYPAIFFYLIQISFALLTTKLNVEIMISFMTLILMDALTQATCVLYQPPCQQLSRIQFHVSTAQASFVSHAMYQIEKTVLFAMLFVCASAIPLENVFARPAFTKNRIQSSLFA
jgi:hypothetical protein